MRDGLGGFLFGNIDEEGCIDDEDLDDVLDSITYTIGTEGLLNLIRRKGIWVNFGRFQPDLFGN
jgi:hypothetical protein